MAAAPLLAPDEPPPARIVNPDGTSPVLLICEHAANRVPRALADLGLPPAELKRHIGWDIGAAAVTERLSAHLDAPAVLATYSRLVVDLNRTLDDPTLMPDVSDGTPVPGNAAITEADRAARLAALYDPFHATVTAARRRIAETGRVPVVIGIHSFTPALLDVNCPYAGPRPWHVGVLWNRDPRLAVSLIEALRAESGLVVGDNEPYSARTGRGHTARFHAEAEGLPWAMLEIRQDLIGTDAGAHAWADRLARIIPALLSDTRLAGHAEAVERA